MTPEEMGTVFAYMRKYRVAAVNPIGRVRYPGEAEVASILLQNSTDLMPFERFLSPQGETLKSIDQLSIIDTNTPGQIYVMARTGETEAKAPYLSSSWVWERMKDSRKKDESKESIVVWTAFIWSIMNSFIYRDGRSIDQISRFMDLSFTKGQLVKEISYHIENMRKYGAPKSAKGETLFKLLTSSNEAEIRSRVSRFISVMIDARCLEQLQGEDEAYIQTLLSAVEMQQCHDRGAAYLIPSSNKISDVISLLDGEVHTSGEDIGDQINEIGKDE